jgi:hypothetical protein
MRNILRIVFVIVLVLVILIFVRKSPMEKYRESNVLAGEAVTIDVCLDKGANTKKISKILDDAWQRLRNAERRTDTHRIDEAVAGLRKADIRHFLIHAGEISYASGLNCSRRKWTIAVKDPWNKSGIIDIIEVTNVSITTFTDRKNLISATVIAPKVQDGSLLARKVTGAGLKKAIALIDEEGKAYGGVVVSQDQKGRPVILESANYKNFQIRKSK